MADRLRAEPIYLEPEEKLPGQLGPSDQIMERRESGAGVLDVREA